MSDLIVRCSSLGHLMAVPKQADLDPEFVTPQLTSILNKSDRSDEEKRTLDEARRKSLSSGAKTHVRDLVRQAIYSYEPQEIDTRPILKGRAVQTECVAMLARLTKRPLVENKERRTNGLITGECDVWDAPKRHGRDIKAPYSMETMPIVLADCYDTNYEWQMRGYQVLWNAETWSVDYVLVSTPDDLIGNESNHVHFVDHIPEAMRWTTWLVKRDRTLESLIEDKVLAARRYFRQVINEFDRTHGGKAPPLTPAPQRPKKTVISELTF